MQALDDIGRQDAPEGSRDACAYKRAWIANMLDKAKTTVSHVRFSLRAMRDKRYFVKLQDRDGRDFQTWEDFCQYPRPWGLGISPALADAIIEERDETKRLSAVAQEVMEKARPLAQHGNGPGRGHKRVDDVNSFDEPRGGNSANYLAARIKRDRPDIAERVEAGEYRSIRAAAIEAGIVKPPCPVRSGQRAFAKMTAEQRAEFLIWCHEYEEG